MDNQLASLPESTASSSSSPSLEDLMKRLNGKTDSERLVGLLLVTKFCDKNDHNVILDVYRALGFTFLHRLLLTGMGRWSGGGNSADREGYLRLSVTVLAAFARVPEIARTDEMLNKVPLILEVMSTEYGSSLSEECFEFLFLVSSAHDSGVITLYESGGMNVLASQMHTLPDGSHTMELAMKLIHLIMSKLSYEKIFADHSSHLSKIVVAIAKQFAVVHNALKFEALHLLSSLFSSSYSGDLCAMLQSMKFDDWSTCIRVGIVDVLQNRVAPADKLQALVLAESVISSVGEEWLIGSTALPGGDSSFPADRCILLILESSRVEIAVILNELAYIKYEASKSSPDAETFITKLRNLGVAFSLVENVIKLISKFGESEDSNSTSIINESILTKIINGLNETIGAVLDYLQDAKDHGQRKGEDLLASVRIVGSYLAEAPCACREKVEELLSYMLSVEGEDESSPCHSVSFLLPMLYQLTMENDGCKTFASTGAYTAVVQYLVNSNDLSSFNVEDAGTIHLACDTILNFLSKRDQTHFSLDCSFVKLLQFLSRWAGGTNDPNVIVTASCICSFILDSTSEEVLLKHPDFNTDNLIAVAQLIKKSLDASSQGLISEDDDSEVDLRQIVVSGYSSWANRFPHIKKIVEG
ncbi:uncharacterized protein LOC127243600 [Andrographis paniculata]|uniref:uncharacterized protein LOC127243600 n=1 Tax=Andrographis paniculata TaxID=175694 RepID=UPI0021E72677|nr:uncharacterized protein LOC127243600 [Andrographis paniculata]